MTSEATKQNSRLPLGIFDSGIGGLTVVKAIHQLLPNERVVYFGDTARVPYGTKSPETVKRYSCENAQLLSRYDVKMIVVACNTSSALALDEVKGIYGGKTVGVVDAGASAAVHVTRTKRVGVIGTTATISSNAYQTALHALDAQIIVFTQACPLFVPLAEEGWTEGDVPRLTAERYLEPLMEKDCDTIILGCTHYPLLKNIIQNVVGQHVVLVDSAQATAEQVENILAQDNLQFTEKPEEDLMFASDDIDKFKSYYRRIVGDGRRVRFAIAQP